MALVNALVSKGFHRANFILVAKLLLRQSQVSEIGFKVFGQGFGKSSQVFLSGLLVLAKVLVRKVIFSASAWVSLALAF